MGVAVQPLHARDRAVLMQPDAMARRCACQTMNEFAHMHRRASGKDQPAEIAVGADFRGHILTRHHIGVRVRALRHQFLRPRQLVIMRGFRRHLELADTLEIAVDRFVPNDLLDRVDRAVEALVEAFGDIRAKTANHAGIILRKAVVAHPAIAPGCTSAQPPGFQQDDARAFLRQRQ